MPNRILPFIKRRSISIVQNMSTKFLHYWYLLTTKNAVCQNFDFAYINLDERTDRKMHIEKLWKHFNLPISRFSAYRFMDKSADPFNEILKRGLEPYMLNKDGSYSRSGAIGCYTSHYFLIKNWDNLAGKYLFYFEDDIQIKGFHFFTTVLKGIQSLPKDWDIILVDSAGDFKAEEKIGDNVYFPHDTFPYYYGAHAVVINPEKKEKIIHALDTHPVRDIDNLFTWNNRGINTYILLTGLCKAGKLGSDINS